MAEFRLSLERVSQRVGLWLARKLDQSELEEVAQTEYRALVEAHSWSWLHLEGFLTLLGPKTDGTVAVTQNSATVQGAGTSFATTDIGRRFRLSSFDQFYEVTAVDVALQRLTLNPAWVSDTATGQTYALNKVIYSLPAEVNYIISMSGRWPIKEVSMERLEMFDPTREASNDQPFCFAHRGRDTDGNLAIEFSPWPIQNDVVRYWGIKRDIADTPDHFLIGLEALLVYQVAAAGALVAMAKALPGSWSDLAQAYQAKADRVLERLLSLDFARSSLPTVQGTRDDALWPLFDPSFQETHDIGLWSGDW